MESIIDNERDEARGVEREPDFDRPTRGEAEADFFPRPVPDIMGRDIVPTFDPEVDPF